MRRRLCLPALALVAALVPACKTLSEVSLGYADAVTTSQLPSEGPWQQVRLELPGLAEIDPLASPSLSRYGVTADEIEAARLTRVELDGATGACGLPFTRVELQIEAAALGSTTIATARATGECLTWELTPGLDLGPWFRQPAVSVVAVVDGQAPDPAPATALSLRLSVLVDIRDKRIE